jgi:hypothetical protein
MTESQQDADKPTVEICAKAEAFVDALLRADSSATWAAALQVLPSLSRDDALAAITRRMSQLPPDQADACLRLGLVSQALEQAKPVEPTATLPPFEAYRRVSAGELTPGQAGDLWRAHLKDGSWDVEWIDRLNAYIGSRSRPDGESELVSFAEAQVEAARAVGDSQLVAMTLATLGGVTMQIEKRVADGLGLELDALESLGDAPPAIFDHYLQLVCTNLDNQLCAVPRYNGAAAVPPLARRVVGVLTATMAHSHEPGAAAAAYQALSSAIDEAALAGAHDVEELARSSALPHAAILEVDSSCVSSSGSHWSSCQKS